MGHVLLRQVAECPPDLRGQRLKFRRCARRWSIPPAKPFRRSENKHLRSCDRLHGEFPAAAVQAAQDGGAADATPLGELRPGDDSRQVSLGAQIVRFAQLPQHGLFHCASFFAPQSSIAVVPKACGRSSRRLFCSESLVCSSTNAGRAYLRNHRAENQITLSQDRR